MSIQRWDQPDHGFGLEPLRTYCDGKYVTFDDHREIVREAIHILNEAVPLDGPMDLADVARKVIAALAAKDAEIAKWKAIAAEGRKAGREEALSIILDESPESPFEDQTVSQSIGETGEYQVEWNERGLRKKLDVEPGATASALERADAFYWTTRDEVDRLRAEVAAAVTREREEIAALIERQTIYPEWAQRVVALIRSRPNMGAAK